LRHSGFLEHPKWEYGESSSGDEFVNLSGGLTFADRPVDALIQFKLTDHGTNFELGAIEFNATTRSSGPKASPATDSPARQPSTPNACHPDPVGRTIPPRPVLFVLGTTWMRRREVSGMMRKRRQQNPRVGRRRLPRWDAFALAFAASIAACSEDGSTAGPVKGDGGVGGQTQDAGMCVPVTCGSQAAECGAAPDGCGGVLTCGACAVGLTCGGGGPNRCGTQSCVPKSCAQIPGACGTVSDGCSATLDCGACSSGTGGAAGQGEGGAAGQGAGGDQTGGASGFGGASGSGGSSGLGGSAGAPCTDPGHDSIETNDSTGVGVNDSQMETIYNPFVLHDEQESVYKMWYAGWQSQTQDFPNDKIYYRTSKDGVTGWSAYQTVFTPGPPHMPTAGYHVNSPAVMKAWNPVTSQFQYTMFFEFAASGTPLQQNESIWSVVSTDGVSWYEPMKLRDAGDDACDVTMVPSYDGYNTYQVLFTGSGGPSSCGDRTHIWRVKADGFRSPNTSDAEPIYDRPPEVAALQGIFANPHAAKVNGRWQLWFNVYHGPPGNHYTAIGKAPCCTSGPGGELGTCSGFEWVLAAPNDPKPGEPCTTATPGILELPGDPTRYRMYQSLGYRSADSICRWYPQFMIHMLVKD